MQRASATSHPALFHVQYSAGHKGGVSVDEMVEHHTISLGFIMQHLAMLLG